MGFIFEQGDSAVVGVAEGNGRGVEGLPSGTGAPIGLNATSSPRLQMPEGDRDKWQRELGPGNTLQSSPEYPRPIGGLSPQSAEPPLIALATHIPQMKAVTELMGSPLADVLQGLSGVLKSGTNALNTEQPSMQQLKLAMVVAGTRDLPRQIQIMVAKGDVESAKREVEKLQVALRQIDQSSSGTGGGVFRGLEANRALQAADRWFEACKERLEALTA